MPPSEPNSTPDDGYGRFRTGLIVLAVVAGVIVLAVLHLTGVLGPS